MKTTFAHVEEKQKFMKAFSCFDVRLNQAVYAAREEKDFVCILENLEEYENLLTPNPKARRAFSILRLQV